MEKPACQRHTGFFIIVQSSMPTQHSYRQEDLPWEPIRKPPRFSPYLRAKVYLFYCALMAIAVGLFWLARRSGDNVDLSTILVDGDTTQLFTNPCFNLDSTIVTSRWLNINHLSYWQLVALGLQPALAAKATIGRVELHGSIVSLLLGIEGIYSCQNPKRFALWQMFLTGKNTTTRRGQPAQNLKLSSLSTPIPSARILLCCSGSHPSKPSPS